jgi:hypothetical protein
MSTEAFTAALVAELAKKTGVSWLTYTAWTRSGEVTATHAVWHTWVETDGGGVVYVVSGGDEQPLPGIEQVDRVEVTMRSKENGGRLVTWVARAEEVTPADDDWEPATAALVAGRLNLADLSTAADQWAQTSRVTRLTPTGEVLEQPGDLSEDAHRAVPRPTPATTRGPLPRILHRRVKRRPTLS